MSEKIYDVPADWTQARLCRRRQVPGDVRALGQGPERLLGRAGQAHRLDQALHQGQEHLASTRTTSRSNGSRTARSTSRTTASTAISRSAATRSPSSGKATIPRPTRKITYRELHDEVCRFANVLKALGVKKGDRVTIYLPMIPEAADRHARLRAHRRHPLGRVRRLLAGLARRPHRRLRLATSSSPPTRACAAAARFRSRPTPTRRSTRPRGVKTVHRRAPHRRRRRHGRPAATSGYDEIAEGRAGRLPARGDERRGPAVHPLHLRLDRQAEGRAAHHRRLSRLRRR